MDEKLKAWSVHAFTATGGIFGVLSLIRISQGRVKEAMWMMLAAVIVDAVDGFFARKFRVKEVLPQFDGGLLDNILDFVTYVIVPAFLVVSQKLVPPILAEFTAAAITLSSSYQFAQADAKTDDHFFKGFPSYWNIVVLHLLLLGLSPLANFLWLMLFCAAVFVPIKFIYPSRPDNISETKLITKAILLATVLWAVLIPVLVYQYPRHSEVLTNMSLSYIAAYWLISIVITLQRPLSKLH